MAPTVAYAGWSHTKKEYDARDNRLDRCDTWIYGQVVNGISQGKSCNRDGHFDSAFVAVELHHSRLAIYGLETAGDWISNQNVEGLGKGKVGFYAIRSPYKIGG